MNKILFKNARINNDSNKKVPRNKEGHFYVVLGAVNAYNNRNELYIDKNFKELLEEEGYLSVANRVTSGLMGGEAMHPRREPGMTDAQFISRNLQIDGIRRAFTIHTVETKHTTVRERGVEKPVTLICGWIECDVSDNGNKLKALLENDNINVVFSIRCFARETVLGNNIWYITKLITFDWVDIPGAQYASKNGIDGLALKVEDANDNSDYISVEIDSTILEEMAGDEVCRTESANYISELQKMCAVHDTDEFVFVNW